MTINKIFIVCVLAFLVGVSSCGNDSDEGAIDDSPGQGVGEGFESQIAFYMRENSEYGYITVELEEIGVSSITGYYPDEWIEIDCNSGGLAIFSGLKQGSYKFNAWCENPDFTWKGNIELKDKECKMRQISF